MPRIASPFFELRAHVPSFPTLIFPSFPSPSFFFAPCLLTDPNLSSSELVTTLLLLLTLLDKPTEEEEEVESLPVLVNINRTEPLFLINNNKLLQQSLLLKEAR